MLVWLAIASACLQAHAHDRSRTIRQFHHTAWATKDGAPPEIWALDQGPDGFLWLGTGSGLYRFDGITFEPFLPAAGSKLESIDITAVKVLPSNEVWIGYSDGGISRLKDGRVTTFLEEDGIWPGMVIRFVYDGDGVLWAVAHGGIARFESGRWRKLGADWGLPDQKMIEMFLARNGVLWLSTAGSIYFLRPGARRFEPTGATSSEATFTQTPDGAMWVADALHGLRPLPDYLNGDPDNLWALKSATPDDVLIVPSYAIDRQGAIWGADRLNGGIFRYDPIKARDVRQSLLASDMTDVFRRADGLTADRTIPILSDREGNIWVGTNAGLNRFRRAEIVPETVVPVTTASGYSIAATPDATYMTDGAWLYRAPPGEPARRFAQLPEIASTLLLGARDGALWYGNHRSVRRLQHDGVTQFAPPEGVVGENIIAIAEGGAGTLWAAFARAGVFRLKDGAWSGKVDLAGLPTPVVAESDPAGDVWFGYAGGRVSRHDETDMRVFSALDGLDVGNVESIAVRNTEVWVGGEFGVALLQGEQFRTIGADKVAPLLGVSGIGQTADGDFLFNGLAGVVRMEAAELRKALADSSYSPPFDLYETRDGPLGVAQQGWHSPTIVTGADGRIWLIGNTGVAILDAGARGRNDLPPPVVIMSLTANGEAFSVAGRQTLPKGALRISVGFTAPSLSAPERVRFRYRLDGLDADWIEGAGRREAAYSNLKPGHYRFRVIAANEDGVWNEDGAALEFDIPPTFFQSGPFKLLCGLALAALLWVLYSIRMRAVAAGIRMRMTERMKERERIAREIHDTLLQSAQALTLRFQLAVDELPAEASARASLEKAIDHADEVIAEGRDRVRDLRSLQNGDIEQIIADIVKRQAFDPHVEVSMRVAGAPRALDPVVLSEVARIASEAIFNIWRHARASHVTVDVDFGADLGLRLSDNGVGIDPEILKAGERKDHFGLPGMRERARKLGGALGVRGLPEGGAEVRLTVPGCVAYKKDDRRRFGSAESTT